MLLGRRPVRPALRPAKALLCLELLRETIISGANCFCVIRPDPQGQGYAPAKADMHQVLSAVADDFGDIRHLRTPALTTRAHKRFFQNRRGGYGLAIPGGHLALRVLRWDCLPTISAFFSSFKCYKGQNHQAAVLLP